MLIAHTRTGNHHSCLYMPQAIGGVKYWAETGLYNVTGGCSRISSLPTLIFTLDGTDYPLNPEDYVLQVQWTGVRSVLACQCFSLPIGICNDL